MAETTKIEWASATWNPWIGCTKVHAGCTNCYAEAQMDHHYKRAKWGPNGTRVKTSDAYWRKPLRWQREAWCEETRRRVFPSLCDPFEDWGGVILNSKGETLFNDCGTHRPHTFWQDSDPDCAALALADLRRDFFRLIDQTPNLDWLLLTKRPENVLRMWEIPANGRDPGDDLYLRRENTWLYYSASDQETLEQGISHLSGCRDLAPVLGLSLEPLLGPVDLTRWLYPESCHKSLECKGDTWPGRGAYRDELSNAVGGKPFRECHCSPIDHVIIGGESGAGARECDIEWIRDIVRQCKDAGVPCFVKQLGSRPFMSGSGGERFDWPCGYTVKGGNTWIETKDKKGGDWKEWPEDLRVREFPQLATA